MTVEVQLRAEGLVHGGEMLARHEGQVVFLRGAAPGDLVTAELRAGGKSGFSGWGTNLSIGGVFVNAPDAAVAAAKEGAGVDVILQLPGQPECKLKGRIAWARPNGPGVAEPGMGIEFTAPDEASQELIGRMMARLAADLS